MSFRVYVRGIVMPAAASILRQVSSKINATPPSHKLMKHHQQHSVAATSEIRQEEEPKPVRRLKIFCGSRTKGWIHTFCSKNDLFVEVDEDFIRDSFNLHGLNTQVLDYSNALDDILESYKGSFDEEACRLYGLIHRRYILSTKGLEAMNKKLKEEAFQKCPRSCCDGQTCLPLGLSDTPGVSSVKFFCPSCEDVFPAASKHHKDIDGAYFGSSFPHLLLMVHPVNLKTRPEPPTSGYVPRVFGFRIHKPRARALSTGKRVAVLSEEDDE